MAKKPDLYKEEGKLLKLDQGFWNDPKNRQIALDDNEVREWLLNRPHDETTSGQDEAYVRWINSHLAQWRAEGKQIRVGSMGSGFAVITDSKGNPDNILFNEWNKVQLGTPLPARELTLEEAKEAITAQRKLQQTADKLPSIPPGMSAEQWRSTRTTNGVDYSVIDDSLDNSMYIDNMYRDGYRLKRDGQSNLDLSGFYEWRSKHLPDARAAQEWISKQAQQGSLPHRDAWQKLAEAPGFILAYYRDLPNNAMPVDINGRLDVTNFDGWSRGQDDFTKEKVRTALIKLRAYDLVVDRHAPLAPPSPAPQPAAQDLANNAPPAGPPITVNPNTAGQQLYHSNPPPAAAPAPETPGSGIGDFFNKNKYGLGIGLLLAILGMGMGDMGLFGALLLGVLGFGLAGMADPKGFMQSMINPTPVVPAPTAGNSPGQGNGVTPEAKMDAWFKDGAKSPITVDVNGMTATFTKKGDTFLFDTKTTKPDGTSQLLNGEMEFDDKTITKLTIADGKNKMIFDKEALSKMLHDKNSFLDIIRHHHSDKELEAMGVHIVPLGTSPESAAKSQPTPALNPEQLGPIGLLKLGYGPLKSNITAAEIAAIGTHNSAFDPIQLGAPLDIGASQIGQFNLNTNLPTAAPDSSRVK